MAQIEGDSADLSVCYCLLLSVTVCYCVAQIEGDSADPMRRQEAKEINVSLLALGGVIIPTATWPTPTPCTSHQVHC